MKDIADSYALSTVEQLRVIADALRQRICDALAARPMTVTQLGELLGEPPAKILYHVRELVRVDLVRLCETREKGGVLEKYYRVVGRAFFVPPTLLQSLSADDDLAAAQALVSDIAQGLMGVVSRRHSGATERQKLSLSRSYRWMTDEEVERIHAQIDRLLEPYELENASPGAEERALVFALYSPRDTAATERRPAKRALAVGDTTYDRAALEAVTRGGESLDLTAVGEVTFADDVTPDLVELSIARFRLQGDLHASADVRAALALKTVQ